MLGSLFALLAALSMAPALDNSIHPAWMYGLSTPVEPRLVQINQQTTNSNIVLPPKKKDDKDLGVVHTGKSVFAADVKSSGILFSYKPHDVHSIASLTKLMTALVVLESDQALDGEMVFVNEDFPRESRATFRIGDTVTRKDLFRALLVGSTNEAANILARGTGMTRAEFVEKMNQKAAELNLNSLKFIDPSGLDYGNQGNAADVAALLTIAIGKSQIREAMQETSFTIITIQNKEYIIDPTNLLVFSYLNKSPYKIIGAKTGSLPITGYNLAQVTRNEQGNEVVVVLLGSDNHYARYRDVKAITAWAFDAYNWNK
jgi:D-alanyl-D-alanine endopeptidase (penicillin-binding protein 7)